MVSAITKTLQTNNKKVYVSLLSILTFFFVIADTILVRVRRFVVVVLLLL